MIFKKNRLHLSMTLVGAAFAFTPVTFTQANTLSLNDYLNEVEDTSPAMHASHENSEGSLKTAAEGDLPLMPKFILQGNHMIDERENTSVAFFGNRTSSDTLTTGIEKQFSFGLNGKITYSLINNETDGASPLIFPPNGINFYTSSQTEIDLTQSLWRNFFGEENKATEKRDEATSLALHFNERYHLKQLRSQAESAYYRLSIARESIQLQREVLDRAKKILDWTTKRVKNRIADQADLYQAQTAYQQRELDLQTGLDEEKSAELAFNLNRNSSSNEVKESLKPISIQEIIAMPLPIKAEETDDIKAAEQSERVNVANNELSRQKALPDFSLNASAAYNGVDAYLSQALGDSFSTRHPMYSIGFKLSFPLFYMETAEIRAGRVKQQLAAEATTQQKRLENEQTWVDLNQKIQEANVRLKMADRLVTAQKEKGDYERYRLNLGRTTTYQVLTFEQDYAQALIQRIRIEQEILTLHSQLKVFEKEAL